MFCSHCGGALASAPIVKSAADGDAANATHDTTAIDAHTPGTTAHVCPHCGKPVDDTSAGAPAVEAPPADTGMTSTAPATGKPAAKPMAPPPPGSLALAWIGLLAAAAWVLKSPHPTWGVGVLCLCAALISTFGARRRGRQPWPAFFTGLLPIGVAMFFALLFLRPLFR